MKLPRWLVILMLTTSALSVLAAAGWWWVTWPERTAREFVELMKTGRGEDAMLMCHEGQTTHDFSDWLNHYEWNSTNVEVDKRTLSDIIAARQKFILMGAWIMEVEEGYVDTRIYREMHWIMKSGEQTDHQLIISGNPDSDDSWTNDHDTSKAKAAVRDLH